MSTEFREGLCRAIAQLEAELTHMRASLEAYDASQLKTAVKLADIEKPRPPDSQRFKGWVPLRAIREVLRENGGRMEKQALIRAIDEGGVNIGKMREANPTIAVNTNLRIGNLCEENGYITLAQKPTDPE